MWARLRTGSDSGIPGRHIARLQVTSLGIATTHQLHELLRRALVVAHNRGALLRHRTSHLLAGFAGHIFISNTDVAIAHDGYPSLDCE
jgi:hypothetical protein